ncbi:MAG: UbiA family prenyltransferase [Planctomycetota bacterium]|nr:UbiA family prenyltransferase [Planctomycetota bacterium]
MPFTIGTTRSYLELARLSNTPTIVTNVLVGVALVKVDPIPGVVKITTIVLAMILLYIGGMALNDVVDAPLDSKERPERPIPSGRISRKAAFIYCFICMSVALGIMVTFNRFALYMALGLTMTIIAYDLFHKRFAGSVILMGLCRSLVYISAGAAMAWPLDWSLFAPPSIAILLYIVLLTLIARVEAKKQPGRRVWLAYLLPLPVVCMFLFLPSTQLMMPLLSGLVLVAWLTLSSAHHLNANPPRIGGAVQGWLAGICLVDAHILALLDQPLMMGLCFICFILTLIGHRFIMGT